MRCKTCDYRLWNLVSRQCPECGTEFLPHEFEFVLNSVQFCCPYCQKAYYGTGDKGHLEPIEFDCVSCHRRIHMDQMVVLPTEGVEEDQTNVGHMPWLERQQIGGVRAWLRSVGMAMTRPGRLIKMVPTDGSTGQACWFAIVTLLVMALGVAALIGGLALVMGVAGAGRGPPPFRLGLGFARSLAMVCGFLAAVMVVWGLVTHGLLRLTGKTACGMGRTFQAIGFSAGAGVAWAVPCLGTYFGWVWPIVSAVIMVKVGQKVHGGRAALAVLTFPGLAIVAMIGLPAWKVSTTWNRTGGFTSLMNAGGETQLVLDGLLNSTTQNSGRWPGHAIELVNDEYLSSYDLVTGATFTRTQGVPVGSGTLEQFDALRAGRKGAVVQTAVNALPPGTIAHRLGDFVFTYHGMDLATVGGQCWVVVMTPDPGSTRQSARRQPIVAGRADGTTVRIQRSRWSTRLNEQNALRVQNGLPQLPDLTKLTHRQPAVGGP